MRLSRQQAYYLRSCLRQLEGLREFAEATAEVLPNLQSEALNDTIDWLRNFIEQGTKR